MTDNPLPIVCPECHYDGCMVVVRSRTVIMVQCVSCRHSWAAELDHLSEEIQLRVQAVLLSDREN
jgi:Zn ribbon nucleic-acid-binding protein